MNAPPSPFSPPPPFHSAGWPAPPPAPRLPQEVHPKGTTVLVLGATGMACAGAFTGLPAWIMGAAALREARAWPGRYSNESALKTGMWLGVASTILSGFLIMVLAGGAISGFTTYMAKAKAHRGGPAKTEAYTSKNGLIRAHYPSVFAARSTDAGTVLLAHNLPSSGDEAVILGGVVSPISDEVPELARVIDLALLENYEGYVEFSREPATCLGGPGMETMGRFKYASRTYQRWACTFIRDGHGYQVSYLVTDGDAAAREPALRAIVDATELLTVRSSPHGTAL